MSRLYFSGTIYFSCILGVLKVEPFVVLGGGTDIKSATPVVIGGFAFHFC